MELSTISDGFRAQIGEGERVVAAVFTTYRFEPEFFEQEIIPLMLDQGLAFSSDQRIKSIQVREALSEAGLPVEVFYDLDLFRQQGTVSPSMEYLHHGIRGERSAFHAKLVLLLLENVDSGEQCLCVGASSANLSIAGWWENIECQHWERVVNGEPSLRFLNQLRADVGWLAARRKAPLGDPDNALPRIQSFLKRCRSSKSASPISYYGLTSLALAQQRRPAFMRFLRDALAEQSPYYKNWTLEIISPYFAENTGFDGHEHFFNDLGVQEIHIFLPENDQGEALCNREYYEHLSQIDGIQWARWSPEMVGRLGLQTPVNRTTHAKIYHLYNGVQSWVFVGSVNFTHRATSDNQEAGFFTQLPTQTSFLKPISTVPDKWCPEDKLPAADEGQDDETSLPDLFLTYDWKLRLLTASLGDRHEEPELVFDILSSEGTVQVADIQVSHDTNPAACDVEFIEALLKNSGFVRVSGHWLPRGEAIPAFEVMVQQVNWTHKPLDLPHLSPQEIMQIYAGLSSMWRNKVIEFLKERQLREMGLLSEGVGSQPHEGSGREFFAEYAELFHAFHNLRGLMDDASSKERLGRVDYYLSGQGMDSLPTLLESLYEDGRELDQVTIYLTLLCLLQIYQRPEYQGRAQVDHYLQECLQKVAAIESAGELRLIDNDAERSHRFFEWYRAQFFRVYRQISDRNDHAAD
ncbi:phospholipase D family protein [Halomonas sp. 25-S5]|uniref:phospholipase D family protein n=1 Tax=Halomonas sp. 25-S5 TaxID=2994065 RepID=UPI0024688F63|nr:phospholipase D family protein [Halomonas sp. 25-S5]